LSRYHSDIASRLVTTSSAWNDKPESLETAGDVCGVSIRLLRTHYRFNARRRPKERNGFRHRLLVQVTVITMPGIQNQSSGYQTA
jgi:hypothetical protein